MITKYLVNRNCFVIHESSFMKEQPDGLLSGRLAIHNKGLLSLTD
jgi:hypothetical protein